MEINNLPIMDEIRNIDEKENIHIFKEFDSKRGNELWRKTNMQIVPI